MITSLPNNVLKDASLRGKEYAWPVETIPSVIASCKAAGLVSLGGQLQFRLPIGTCECYWVEVRTLPLWNESVEWDELVDRSASIALMQFEALQLEYDFVEEGRKAFGRHFSSLESEGDDPQNYACFVWYARNREYYLQE